MNWLQANGSMMSDILLRVSMAIRQPTFENLQDDSAASWASMGELTNFALSLSSLIFTVKPWF